MEAINEKSFIIATHVYAPGPAQELLKYLNDKKCRKIMFIGHPLFFDSNLKGSGFDIFENGVNVKSEYSVIKKIPEILSFFKVFVLNIFWVILYGRSFDVYVGSDNLNALSGVVLKFFGLVKKTVYYVIDYNPKRFSNKVLNFVYHKIDQICVRYCDETWNLSPRMIEGRKEHFNFADGNQKVVPMGVWYDEMPRVLYENCQKHTLGFIGHILEKQGLQLVINCLPELSKKFPDVKVRIIGDGPYLENLKILAKDLGVERYIDFLGFIKEQKETNKLISECALGLALYDPDKASFSYYADPGKIKFYLSCGVPPVLTNVPLISEEIISKNSGLISNYDANSLIECLAVLSDETKMKEFRITASALGAKYAWDNIFGDALKLI